MTTMFNWYALGWLHAALAVVGVALAYRIKKGRRIMPPDSVGVILVLVGALVLMAAGVIG